MIISLLSTKKMQAQNTAWPNAGSSNNVGLGTNSPQARLHVADGNNTVRGSSVLFEGVVGGTPVSGAGTRFMWIPAKAALRFGRVNNTLNFMGQTIDFGEGSDYWNDSNIGEYSFATGFNNRAAGFLSHAFGGLNKVDGMASFAIGLDNNLGASNGIFAFGEKNETENYDNVFLIGKDNTVAETNAMTIGMNNYTDGANSVSVGRFNNVYNSNTYAFGQGLTSGKDEVILIGRNNVVLNNSNVAIEFGIGTSQGKNGLTLYNDGSVQFNELPGTGNALAIDANGFVTRTTASGGGGGGSFWQANGSTNEIFYSNPVTIGQTNANRPGDAQLWVNGKTHSGWLEINNPVTGWFNDVSQKIRMTNFANLSMLLWGGDDLTGNDGNEFQFRFQSNTGSGLPWNDPIGQLALSITPNGSIRTSGSALNIFTEHGNIAIGPKNSSFCHIETNRPRFLMEKPLTINTGQISSNTNQNLQLQTNNTTRLTILNSNGNVGIGTTAPKHLLQVGNMGLTGTHANAVAAFDGKIVAKNVVTTLTGWADFVFDEDYELMPLEELNEFVKTNKHLPEIPTEAEVLENGIDVGEINTKLLQKVEELTLYIIQLEQRMKALEGN